MPIQPLELYKVEETGELVLEHKYLQDALISRNAIMIVNHNDKEVVLWIGKGASTRSKFAAARSSRRYLTERSFAYRVKTCDEGDEPDWFQKLFKIKVAKRSRDEPPSLEVLSILNEMNKEPVPEGVEREACIISRDFYVPVERKSSIMGKDTTTTKFDKSALLPEGFFNLPAEAYRLRLLVRSGKILGIDLLVNYDISARDRINIEVLKEADDVHIQIQNLEQIIRKREKKIDDLKGEISKKDQEIEKSRTEIKTLKKERESMGEEFKDKEKDSQLIKKLQQDVTRKEEVIKNFQQDKNKKEQQIETFKQEIDYLKPEIEKLQQQGEKNKSKIGDLELKVGQKGQLIDDLQRDMSIKEQQIEGLKQEIIEKDSEIETVGREDATRSHEIEELQQNISKKNKEIQEKESIIEEMEKALREKERRVQELEAKDSSF